MLRYVPLLSNKDPFDQSSYTGTSLKMADIGFDRPYYERVIRLTVLAKHLRNGLGLFDVTRLGTSAMTLHIRCAGNVQACIAIYICHISDLALLARKCNAFLRELKS